MNRLSICVLIAAIALPSIASTADTRRDPNVAGRYIVKLRPTASRVAARAVLNDYKRKAELSNDREESGSANAIEHEYSRVLNGFAGSFTPDFLSALRARMGRQIEYVVPDTVVHAFDEPPSKAGRKEQASPPSWGLTRVSQRAKDAAAPYRYPDNFDAQRAVDVWVVDTGINFNHTDFGGRASMNATFVQEPEGDLNGHGSHCAGTVGGTLHGVAKNVRLLGVKVLNRQGSGTLSGVIGGIDHVAKHVRPGKTVISMSLGGGKNQALNDAVDNAFKAGVVVVVAAGNNNGDACQISPAGASGAYTVGAIDNTDTKSSYSNWGKCVKINAPGTNITSVWTGAADATRTISGTSMATPHVAGVAALIMSQNEFTAPQQVYDALTKLASPNVIKGLGNGTPNLLLYNGESDEKDWVPPSAPEEPKPTEPAPTTPEQPKPEQPKPEQPTPEQPKSAANKRRVSA